MEKAKISEDDQIQMKAQLQAKAQELAQQLSSIEKERLEASYCSPDPDSSLLDAISFQTEDYETADQWFGFEPFDPNQVYNNTGNPLDLMQPIPATEQNDVLLKYSQEYRELVEKDPDGIKSQEWSNKKQCSQCGSFPRDPYCRLKVCPVRMSLINLDLVFSDKQKAALRNSIKYVDCFTCGRSGRWDDCVNGICRPYINTDAFRACLNWLKWQPRYKKFGRDHYLDPPWKTTVAWSVEFPPDHQNRKCRNCKKKSWLKECYSFECSQVNQNSRVYNNQWGKFYHTWFYKLCQFDQQVLLEMHEKVGCLSCGALKTKLTPSCATQQCPKTLGSYFRFYLGYPMQSVLQRDAFDEKWRLRWEEIDRQVLDMNERGEKCKKCQRTKVIRNCIKGNCIIKLIIKGDERTIEELENQKSIYLLQQEVDRKKATVARLKAIKNKREKDMEAKKAIEEAQELTKKVERDKLEKLRVIGSSFRGGQGCSNRIIAFITCFNCFTRYFPLQDACKKGNCKDVCIDLTPYIKQKLTDMKDKYVKGLRDEEKEKSLENVKEACTICQAAEKTDLCYMYTCKNQTSQEVLGLSQELTLELKIKQVEDMCFSLLPNPRKQIFSDSETKELKVRCLLVTCFRCGSSFETNQCHQKKCSRPRDIKEIMELKVMSQLKIQYGKIREKARQKHSVAPDDHTSQEKTKKNVTKIKLKKSKTKNQDLNGSTALIAEDQLTKMLCEAILHSRVTGLILPGIDQGKRRDCKLRHYARVLLRNQNALKEELLMRYDKVQIDELCKNAGVDVKELMYGASSGLRFSKATKTLLEKQKNSADSSKIAQESEPVWNLGLIEDIQKVNQKDSRHFFK